MRIGINHLKVMRGQLNNHDSREEPTIWNEDSMLGVVEEGLTSNASEARNNMSRISRT